MRAVMRDALAHLVVQRFGRGDKKSPRAGGPMRERERMRAFAAARPSGYQRHIAHALIFLPCQCSAIGPSRRRLARASIDWSARKSYQSSAPGVREAG